MSLYLGDTPIAGNPYDCASTDLNNLTSTGKNIANWSSNVTNCIIEIPQDIKLELNNGTLTLKAGSKLYVPNGSGVFDVVTIANDLSVTRNINSKELYVYNINENSFSMWQDVYSGSSAPSGQTWMLWYDTSSNKVKATGDGGSTWNDGFSLPVCSATSNSTQIISIDKIFNGFGYIGSTVFALPGVKGLAPNGRNIDGTYNTAVVSVNSVLTKDITGTGYKEFTLSSAISWGTGGYFVDEDGYLYAKANYSKALNTVIFGSCDIITAGTFDKISFKKAFSMSDSSYVVDTYKNGTSWCRVYSDGWCEQGGHNSGTASVSLLKSYKNTDYNILIARDGSGQNVYEQTQYIHSVTTSSFGLGLSYYGQATGNNNSPCYWQACGYIA